MSIATSNESSSAAVTKSSRLLPLSFWKMDVWNLRKMLSDREDVRRFAVTLVAQKLHGIFRIVSTQPVDVRIDSHHGDVGKFVGRDLAKGIDEKIQMFVGELLT